MAWWNGHPGTGRDGIERPARESRRERNTGVANRAKNARSSRDVGNRIIFQSSYGLFISAFTGHRETTPPDKKSSVRSVIADTEKFRGDSDAPLARLVHRFSAVDLISRPSCRLIDEIQIY